MKEKQIVVLTVAALFSAQVMATEMTHSTLISHKEWNTGNLTGTFVTNNEPANLNVEFAKQKIQRQTLGDDKTKIESAVEMAMHEEDVVVPVLGKITLSGKASTFIKNVTDKKQIYKIETVVYLCYFDFNLECDSTTIAEDYVAVPPADFYALDNNVKAIAIPSHSGTWFTAIERFVEPEGTPYKFIASTELIKFTIPDSNR